MEHLWAINISNINSSSCTFLLQWEVRYLIESSECSTRSFHVTRICRHGKMWSILTLTSVNLENRKCCVFPPCISPGYQQTQQSQGKTMKSRKTSSVLFEISELKSGQVSPISNTAKYSFNTKVVYKMTSLQNKIFPKMYKMIKHAKVRIDDTSLHAYSDILHK